MALARVRISNVRCLTEVDVTLHPRRSYVFGANGAGKTSFLEALFLLGRGRSFRTRQLQRLVRRGTDGLAVYGEIASSGDAPRRVGVAWNRGHLDKRIDGREAGSMAELADVLRVHVIDPSSHGLVEGGPSERRRFLDWGVFHVEHTYLEAWKRYRRALSQRNAALKRGARRAELDVWTDALIGAGVVIDGFRRAYVERLNPQVAAFGQALLDRPLALAYRGGWPKDLTLAEALAASATTERGAVTTDVGPHRADLVLEFDGMPVQDTASRGQQKLTAAALVLGQVAMAEGVGSTGTLLLVDDPAAELDATSLGRLLSAVGTLQVQQIFTALSADAMPVDPEGTVFHVEQGSLRAL